MSDVRRELDRAAARGTEWLERRHQRRTWKDATLDALAWTWVGPLVLAVAWLVAWALGLGHAGYGWVLPLLAVLAVPAVVLGRELAGRWSAEFRREEGLAVLDERLELADRLRSADEFLGEEEREGLAGAFARAAIGDAERHLERVARADLADEPAPWRSARAARLAGGVALLGVGLVWLLPSLSVTERPGIETTDEVATRSGAAEFELASDEPAGADAPPARDDAERASDARPASRESVRGADPGTPSALPDEAKDVEGRSARGESGEASSSAGSSEARGVPSDQGQSSKGGSRKPKQKKKAKKKTDAKDQEPSKKKEGEKSGSTAGLGSASGSNKNPASTSWSSKDQVTDTEDEEIEDDEEVEDEDSESEARGGVQPTLRDRKPAASRDLSIGFGNRPNPNARGRGGPSQPKKSRGTASLILGVPIPDHVKGQPNPGKTKITQERIEPKADPLRPGEASRRDERRLPVGRVPESTLTPWMRDLVRDFFLDVRAQSAKSTAPPKGE